MNRLTDDTESKQLIEKNPVVITDKNVLNPERIFLWKSPAIVTCEICFEEYAFNDGMYMLPCMHYYHYECINMWARTCLIKELPGACPMCDSIIS